MRPALIATDLDGTFLGTGAALLPSNLAAARRAIQEGVIFVVATGRPRRWLDGLQKLRDLDPVVISSNGAVTSRLAASHPDHLHPVKPESALAFAAALPPELETAFAVEYEYGWGREPDYPVGVFSATEHEAPLEELLRLGPVVKVLARTRHAGTHAFAPIALATAGETLQSTFSWHDACGTVELSAPGVTKGTALARLLEELDIEPAETVAFGDMHNDLGMLELVGHGYVMAGADPCLLGREFTQLGNHYDGAVGKQIQLLLDN
jgi:Predicted hydrolases of the HAD superfamily